MVSSAFGGPSTWAGIGNALKSSAIGKAVTGSNLLKTGTLLAGSALMTNLFGSPQKAAQLYSERPEAVSMYLGEYYKQVNPKKEGQSDEDYAKEVSDFISRNTAEYTTSDTFAIGGRVGYAKGTDRNQGIMELKDADPNLRAGPDWYIKRIEALMYEYDMDYDTAAEIAFDSNKYFELMPDGLADGGRPGYDDDEEMQQAKALSKKEGITLNQALTKMLEERFSRDRSPIGRTKKAYGDTASMASEVEGLPFRQNKAGVGEVDLRETGGFIPPVGIKEKADDIPAMLSNNEFVFTADAVRGMGNGDVNKGAQRMYDMMKKLEKGGRV